MRGRKLVDQASQRLIRERVEHATLMANHWNYRPYLPNAVASIDTLIARKMRPKAGLIIVDEAHLASSDGYRGFLEGYPEAFVLAVTATPYMAKGLGHLASSVVKPISMQELVAQGYLVPGRYFAPVRLDLSAVAVSKSTGDYDHGQLETTMDRSALIGDIVREWRKHGEQRPTIAFAVSVEHSKHIVGSFLAQGIPAEHLDADSSDEARERAIARLRLGATKVVSNVGILTTGVDIPEASCGIVARPTRSYCLYVQMTGRLTRPAPGKRDFILLDHGGVIERHGFIDEEPDAVLDGTFTKEEPRVFICRNCFLAFREAKCPGCGWEPKARAAETAIGGAVPEEVAGELVERTAEEIRQERREQELARDAFRAEARAKGFEDGWVWYQLKRKFGAEVASRLTQDRLPPWQKWRRG